MAPKWLLVISILVLGVVDSGPVRAQHPTDRSSEFDKETLERLSQLEIDYRRLTTEERSNMPPLMERYVLDELKALRMELQSLRLDAMREIRDREYRIADQAVSFSSRTVEFFFYVIAVAGGLLTILGWNSLRELKRGVSNLAEGEFEKLKLEYEERLTHLEADLQHKSQVILENQHEIEKTQRVQSLWMQANQAPNPRAKLALYEELLTLLPDDPEVMAYKADAALQLEDRDWALSLCNRILTDHPDYSLAYYQRACACAGLEQPEAAIADLKQAVELSESLRQDAVNESEFEPLKDNEEFLELIGGVYMPDGGTEV